MPASVANASATTVMPLSLCSAFSHSREWPTEINEYRNGESQRRNLCSTSRKRWQQTRIMTSAEMATLRDFWEARKGPTQAFYYYDPFEPATGQPVGSNYDATGASSQGRYVVRFDGQWNFERAMARGTVPIALVELA